MLWYIMLGYFMYQNKNVTNLSKLYLLPNINAGIPVIFNCGTRTEKAPVLDHHLKSVMQQDKSDIKDSGDFINKIKG